MPQVRRTIHDAEFVTLQRGDASVVVGFTDDEFAPREYVLLERSLKVTDEEAEMGLGQVYIERNDQRYADYGGIRQCILTPAAVELLLEPATAQTLRTRW